MKNFRPISNWVALETTFKEQKETEHGIIYTDNQLKNGGCVWSTVHSIGQDVKEDIQPGDEVFWKLGSNQGAFYKDTDITLDLVREEHLLAVRRETN